MDKIKYFVLDSGTMFKRCMRLSFRNLDVLITSVILPVMMMVMFVYLFGGAIDVGDVNYVNYVVPGVFILTIGYCAALTSVSVHSDMSKGIIDRFRSMPITKSSVLMGHVLTSVVRNCISTAIVIIVALIIGFRPVAGIVDWFIVASIMILYMLVITWSAVLFGLLAKTPDGAGSFSFVILLLPYLSSGFVPTKTMPTILQVVADNQPLTPIIESLRSLLMNSSAGVSIIPAIVWCIALLSASYFISAQVYNYKIKG